MFILKLIHLITLVSLSAVQNYEIDSKVLFLGEKVGAPRVSVLEGRKAKFVIVDSKSKEKFNLELIPKILSKDMVRLQYSFLMRKLNHETFSRGSIDIPKNREGRVRLDNGKVEIQLQIREI